MHIAIYSAFFSPTSIAYIKTVIEYLRCKWSSFTFGRSLKKHLGQEGDKYLTLTTSHSEENVDFLFSVGGDGTLLRSIAVISRYENPNFGNQCRTIRLFNLSKKRYTQEGLDLFFQGKYTLVERSLFEVTTKNPSEALQEFGYALNEVPSTEKTQLQCCSIDTKLR